MSDEKDLEGEADSSEGRNRRHVAGFQPSDLDSSVGGLSSDEGSWLASIDSRLDLREEEERNSTQARKRGLETEHRHLAKFLTSLNERLARSRKFEAAELVEEIQDKIQTVAARKGAIVDELGFDPDQVRRDKKEHEREEKERLSHDSMALLLSRIGDVGGEKQIRALEAETFQVMPGMQYAHMAKVLGRLQAAAHSRGLEMDPLLEEFLQRLSNCGDSPPDPSTYAQLQRKLENEYQARTEFAAKVKELQMQSVDIESKAHGLPRDAVYHRIHEICCRAKSLQEEFGQPLSEDLQTRLRREVFGKLGSVAKTANADYIPSLSRGWQSPDYASEIANARKGYREAVPDPVAKIGAFEPSESREDQEETERLGIKNKELSSRILEAERWVLAEVYRRANQYIDDRKAPDAANCLQQVVSHALRFLVEYRDRLPMLLLGCREALDKGSDFRWLRKRMVKLSEENISESRSEDAAVHSDESEDISLESITGESIVHPSIHAARRWSSGRQVLLVGGVVDETRRARLERLLEADMVDWVPAERNAGMGRIQMAADRLSNGTYAYVVYLLGYLSHKATGLCDDAARSKGIPIARVVRGFGIVGIAEAIRAAAEGNTSSFT